MVRKVVLNESLGDKLSQALAQRTDKSGASAGTIVTHAEDGTKTILGEATGAAGIVPFVGDTTPPPVPSAPQCDGSAGVLVVSWDGAWANSAEATPPDFAGIIVEVKTGEGEFAEVDRSLTRAGSVPVAVSPGTYTVRLRSVDDAHAEDLTPAPNVSEPSTEVTVTVSTANIDPSQLGITVTKSQTDPDVDGENKGDLWLKFDKDPALADAGLVAEWWWNTEEWVPIPVAMYLDQLAARGVNADSAVIGMIATGIITSGSFRATDGAGNVTVHIDGATGKLTAVEAELVDANVSGTFQNLTSTTSTTIDTDGIEIKGTGWKFQNSEPVPEFIAGKCFASESSSIAGGVWPRTIYTWKSDGSSLYNMTKITLSGINIDALTWLGASKLAVLYHDEASGIYTWKVMVVNLSGVTQATYTVPNTTPSSGSAVIAQIPGGSGFYVAVGRYGATGNVYRYDSSGVVQSSWSLPVSSPGSNSTVRAIAVDSAGNLYLAQDWTISSYTSTGTLRWSFAGTAWTMTYDNWHGYLVVGQGYGITWYVGATGVEVDRIISPDRVQGLVYSSGDLFVSSNVGPKIIRAMWGTPSNGIGDSVVIDASSGNAAFRNIVTAMSVQSNFPMLQADGERVTGTYVVTQRSDLDSIPTSHLVPGLSRGYVQHVASNQTDYGDYVWTGSAWVKSRVLLFDNDSAPVGGATTLSETAANFVCFDIMFRTNDHDYSSVRVYRPNGKRVSLMAARTSGGNQLWVKTKTVLVSGTTIDTVNVSGAGYLTGEVNVLSGQYNLGGGKDTMAITQVIGYRTLDAL